MALLISVSGVYIGVYTGSYSLTCMFSQEHTHTPRKGWVRVIDLKSWPCDSIDRGRPTHTETHTHTDQQGLRVSPLDEVWLLQSFCSACVISPVCHLFAPTQWTERVGSDTSADSAVSFALTSYPDTGGRERWKAWWMCVQSGLTVYMLKWFLEWKKCFTISVICTPTHLLGFSLSCDCTKGPI